VYSLDRATTMKGNNYLTIPIEPRHLTARRPSPKGNRYVALYVARDGNPGVPNTHNRTLMMLEIVDAAPIEIRKVIVDAAAMAKEIAAAGEWSSSNSSAMSGPETPAGPVVREIGTLVRLNP
jgi:hypothetical protein